MNYGKSVSFDEEAMKIVKEYQSKNGIWIFSKAINQIIKEYKKGAKNDEK